MKHKSLLARVTIVGLILMVSTPSVFAANENPAPAATLATPVRPGTGIGYVELTVVPLPN